MPPARRIKKEAEKWLIGPADTARAVRLGLLGATLLAALVGAIPEHACRRVVGAIAEVPASAISGS